MDHGAALEKLCRVCGRSVVSRSVKTKYPCHKLQEKLMEVFGIAVEFDNPTKHPTHFCHACKSILNKATPNYRHLTAGFSGWCSHMEDGGCAVCEQHTLILRGGRPKRNHGAGRPTQISPRYCMDHIRAVAPAPLPLHHGDICEAHLTVPLSAVECPICCYILRSPVELVTCMNVVCAECLCSWLKQKNSLACPCCFIDHLQDFSTIRQAAPLVVTLLCVVCGECKDHVKLTTYCDHNCQPAMGVLPHTNIDDLLNQSVTTPLTAIEQKLQTSLVRRSLSTSSENILQLKTGGKPLTFVQVRQAQVPTGRAAPRTVRERSQSLSHARIVVTAGDEAAQMAHEVMVREQVEREKLLGEIKKLDGNFLIRVPQQASLAMKADLNIPWHKLRIIRRWLSKWGIGIASEKKMRHEARELVGDNLCAELAPFSFPHKEADGGEIIKHVPCAYVPNLWEKIKGLLDQNSDDLRGVHRITWHKGAIPEDEVWLKLGGDKGGGTFKMCFQLLNVTSPNSPDNTCVFSIFEGPDTYTNINIALRRHTEEILALESQTWRGKKIRTFLCGDYEFLCRIYGLSGASGRHCCLWCHISQDKLPLPPRIRGPVTPRTVDTITSDHKRFNDAGFFLKDVKFFNNCLNDPFFPKFSLSQVCPPGLHITLGIFMRLFVLLEEDCHKLDMSMDMQGGDSGPSYEKFLAAMEDTRELKDEQLTLQSTLALLEQLLTHSLLSGGAISLSDAQIQPLVSAINTSKGRLKDIQAELAGLAKVTFRKDEGPFVKSLDKALSSFHVQRQAYYSGTFVGNHVHRALKDKNISTLCHSVVSVAEEHCPTALPQAKAIEAKYREVLSLFQECHKLYDSNALTDADISTLDTKITMFMGTYRTSFPKATVLPKMHMLEEHVVPWLRQWHIGFGMMGEQGAESIHAYFNSLKRICHGNGDPVQKLKQMMNEHLLHIAPANVAAKPVIKKRKKSIS